MKTPRTYQAIETRYLSPTNLRGARIVAECCAKKIILHWDHTLNVEENHFKAARILVERLDWKRFWTRMAGGQLKGGTYVWCQANK